MTAITMPNLVLAPQRRHFLGRLLNWCRRYKVAAAAGTFLLMLSLAAIFAPIVAPYSPTEFISGAVLKSPNNSQLLGGDELGRDVLSRLIYGGRISLRISASAVLVATVVGTMFGILSGMANGIVDIVTQRIVDMMMVFPSLLLALLLVAVLEPSIGTITIAISVPYMPIMVRVVRSSVILVKEYMYVEAARSIGASPVRLALQHILPNVLAPVFVLATIMAGTALIAEASLGFLGLSVPPPQPTWGSMLSGASRQYFTSAPWMAIAPGVLITLVVLSLNMVGDALRDSLDPRLRNR